MRSSMPAPGDQPLLRARGLTAVAYLLEQAGGYATAEHYCEEGLAIARAAEDDYLIADRGRKPVHRIAHPSRTAGDEGEHRLRADRPGHDGQPGGDEPFRTTARHGR
jgi:hypothetical protein